MRKELELLMERDEARKQLAIAQNEIASLRRKLHQDREFDFRPVPDLSVLERGDIVRHKMDGADVYVVTANYGSRVTAVRSVDICNPIEWEVVR